jgi:hypothetical protein
MPWVLFEAGALAKALDHSVVCPYLLDVKPSALEGPLNQFNAVMADEGGTLGLFRSINRALPPHQRLDDDILRQTFQAWWPRIKEDLSQTPPAPVGHTSSQPDQLFGIEYVAETRGSALEYFKKYLDAEIKRGKQGRITMVGTSGRGFLVYAGGGFSGRDLIREALRSGVELRIMLVDPVFGDQRASFEGLPPNKISVDIRSDLTQLSQLGISRESIHFYSSGPTVFGIATTDRMLLNPYPSCREAHAGFTLVARKTDLPSDIYQQYVRGHFDDLWLLNSKPVPEADWPISTNGSAV